MSPTLRAARLPAPLRRSQLLEAALALFADRGFHHTSMDDIAERAGVTKPVLYQHFRSKQKLYLELLETVGAELVAVVEASASGGASPHQQVLAGFEAYFRFVSERTSAFRLLFGRGARGSDEFADTIRAVEDTLARTVAGFIDADLDDGHRSVLGYAIVGLAEVTGRYWVTGTEQTVATAAGPDRGDGTDPGRAATGTTVDHLVSTAAGIPRPGRMAPEEGDLLARRLADLAWAGLRGLRPDRA